MWIKMGYVTKTGREVETCVYSNADQLPRRSTVSNQNILFHLKDLWLKSQPSAQLSTAFAVRPLGSAGQSSP